MAVSNYLSTQSRNELEKSNKNKKPIKSALATFFSFLIMGFIPLLIFVIIALTNLAFLEKHQFLYAIILTGVSLLIIGYLKGKVRNKHKLWSAMETLLIGGIASLLAYYTGYLLKVLIG